MSYDFDSASSARRINHGSGATLDFMGYGAGDGFCVWAWVKRTSDGSNQHIITKESSFPLGWSILADNASGEGEIRFVVYRGTTHSNRVSVSGLLPLNTWKFVAASYYEDNSPEIRIYAGDVSTSVAEVSYGITQDGSGGAVDDSAASVYVGNLQRATTYPFRGQIARVGIIDRGTTVVTSSDLDAIRQYNASQASSCNVSGTVLLADYGTAGSSQTDLSGNSNTGTVTDAVYSSDSPWSSTTSIPVFMSQYRRRR
jgi:hypothetical protein